MNKSKLGLFLLAFLLMSLSSCKQQDSNSKILINEVLVNNTDNYLDEYGMHDGWIELVNRTYKSVNIAGYQLSKITAQGDTITYVFPKGDTRTMIQAKQHILIFADANPYHGALHASFSLDTIGSNRLILADAGGQLLDEVTLPSTLGENESYARISEKANNFEVRGKTRANQVTAGSINDLKDHNAKANNFKKNDKDGVGMAITAMSVVFTGLLLLYLIFRTIGNLSVKLSKRRALRSAGLIGHKKEEDLATIPGEVFAAIATALHEAQNDVHDIESTILTINKVKRSYSPWSSKIYGLRQTPNKKSNPYKK
ncbi:MAG: OadG family transporter subunit [Bacteroidaceae bacterium]|nr:OadG family transporter subunit [Bacteroidaceae bacterium]